MVPYPTATVYGMIGVDSGICSKGGDSGSPITWANDEVAVGIMSGSSNENDTANPDNPGCSSMAYVEPINRAISTLNITLYGGPPA